MKRLILCIFTLGLASCAHTPESSLPKAEAVNLQRFMGDWYVIANIPTFIEKDAHNAVESYSLNEDGTVATRFSFREGGFDGDKVTYNPTGFVSTEDNSVWGMQFIWPIKAEYVIAYLSDDYQYTIIARSARDYLWIMARQPVIDEAVFDRLVQLCADMGYDVSKIQRVPQRWPEQETASHESP